MIYDILVACPYCGERFETSVDASGGSMDYIEDCAVCCRPIEFRIAVDAAGELIDVRTRDENDG
jgi:hypothetical protein